MKKNNFPLLF